MNKNIKDYLHLYLNCEVMYNNMVHVLVGVSSPYKTTDTTFARLDLRPDGKGFREIKYTSVSTIELHTIKLLLRPLSSMTEEEMFELLNSMVPDDFENAATIDEYDFEMFCNDGGNMVDADVAIGANFTCRCYEGQIVVRQDGSIHQFDEDGKAENIYKQPEALKYLLSKHFDLFGLLDARLAIDKTAK